MHAYDRKSPMTCTYLARSEGFELPKLLIRGPLRVCIRCDREDYGVSVGDRDRHGRWTRHRPEVTATDRWCPLRTTRVFSLVFS